MKHSNIKNIKEKALNDKEKQVEITFETKNNDIKKVETITLSGSGSIKTLTTVV